MHDLTLLADILVLVAVALPAVALAERLRIPPIVAFLLSGIAVGPNGLGWIDGTEEIAALAELGVVLLLFEVGLEVSLVRVIKMGWTVLVGGALQLALTIAAVSAIAVGVMPPNRAIVFGCLVALSSTAVVLQVYRGRGELDSPEGKVALGILLFQDLAVVPLMVLVPLLGGVTAEGAIGGTLLKALLVLVAVVLGGRVAVPWVLDRVVGLRTRDLFTLALALFGLGAAYLTAWAGLSLALGAFLAGIVISESEYGAQAMSDVLPFRALFSGIFFMSVGMLLDLSFVAARPGLVLGIAASVIAGKAVIVTLVTALALRRGFVVSVAAGLGLAQVGEFAFVLAGVAVGAGVLDEPGYQLFLAATVLSMLATPFLIAAGRPVGRALVTGIRRTIPTDSEEPPPAQPLEDHAIIIGYGMAGRHLASALKAVHLPYRILEVNGRIVRRAQGEGEPISFGDGTRREVLQHAGAEKARVVVFAISSPVDEFRGVAMARSLNHSARIVVRTRIMDSMPALTTVGASDVIVEEYEATLELFERVLRHYSIPNNVIMTQLDAIRSQHYGILRGVPKDALHLDDLKYLGIHHALELIEVEEGSAAVGESPHSLDLRGKTHASVVAVVRQAQPIWRLTEEFRFEVGDVAVLVGESPSLVLAERIFVAKGQELARPAP